LIATFLVGAKAETKGDASISGKATSQAEGGPAATNDWFIVKPGKFFLIADKPMTWAKSRKECQRRGGDLASLVSVKDLELVFKSYKAKDGGSGP